MIIEIPYVEHQFTDVTKPTIIDLLERCLGNDTHAYFAQYKNTVVMKELHDNGIIIITKNGDKKQVDLKITLSIILEQIKHYYT